MRITIGATIHPERGQPADPGPAEQQVADHSQRGAVCQNIRTLTLTTAMVQIRARAPQPGPQQDEGERV